MLRILPVAEARQVAVGPAFPVVLGRGLPVHLQQTAAWPAQHAAEQVQVVDLARGRRRVGRLVEALQDRGKHPVFGAEDLRRAPHVGGLHAAGFGHFLRGPWLHHAAQLVHVGSVLGDVGLIDPAVGEELADQPVHQRQVGARMNRQMHVGPAGHLGITRVNAHELRRVGPVQPVQHARPQHRLRLRHVVAVEEDGAALIDVRIAAGLTVGTEGLLQRRRSRGGAQRVLPSMCGVPIPALPRMPSA
jgi:hypothetical protein